MLFLCCELIYKQICYFKVLNIENNFLDIDFIYSKRTATLG